MIKRKFEIYRQNSAMTPLTSQVEALASSPTEKINNIREEADSKIKLKNVTFQLSPQHINRDSTEWGATPRHIKFKNAPKSGKCKTPQNTTEKTVDARRNQNRDSKRDNSISNQLHRGHFNSMQRWTSVQSIKSPFRQSFPSTNRRHSQS